MKLQESTERTLRAICTGPISSALHQLCSSFLYFKSFPYFTTVHAVRLFALEKAAERKQTVLLWSDCLSAHNPTMNGTQKDATTSKLVWFSGLLTGKCFKGKINQQNVFYKRLFFFLVESKWSWWFTLNIVSSTADVFNCHFLWPKCCLT